MTLVGDSARIPRNHSTYASAAPMTDRYAYPAMFAPVSAGGGPSTKNMNGSSTSPPATSCHPVVASRGAGDRHRLARTTPVAMTAAPPIAATTPRVSSRAPARSTSRLTPATPAAPATIVRVRSRSPSRPADRHATSTGWMAPTVAATPPGSRYAATNSNAKNAPMLRVPRTRDRHHQSPRGSCRTTAVSSSPAGRARTTAASSGRSGGRSSLVTRYVVPQMAGARARPDLDVSPMGVIGRLSRLSRVIDAELRRTFATHDLDAASFDVLATLRRNDRPLTPADLMRSSMVTSGAITQRLDRLASRGLVTRTPSPTDGRVVHVSLTEEGRALIDRALPDHVATEHRILASLDGPERDALAGVLRDLLVTLESDA